MDKRTGKGKSIVPQLKMLTYMHLFSPWFKSFVIQKLISFVYFTFSSNLKKCSLFSWSNRPKFSIFWTRAGRHCSLLQNSCSLFFGLKSGRVLYFVVLYKKKSVPEDGQKLENHSQVGFCIFTLNLCNFAFLHIFEYAQLFDYASYEHVWPLILKLQLSNYIQKWSQ